MDAGSFLQRRAVKIVLGVGISLNLLGAFGAWYMLGGGSHPLTVDRALDRFRGAEPTASSIPTGASASSLPPSPTPSSARTTSPPGTKGPTSTGTATPTHPKPEEGVYVYDTQGSEHTDALSGQTHDYPSQTTITISDTKCGQTSRWQPLSERWDESITCAATSGVVLHRFTMYHEFFHRGQREDFDCGSDAVVMPWHQVAGDHWTFHCHSDRSNLTMAVRVIGFENVSVAGHSIRAVHIRYEGTVTGADQGAMNQDRWLSTERGLFVRIESSADAMTQTSFGRFHYTERYRLDLTSTTPRR